MTPRLCRRLALLLALALPAMGCLFHRHASMVVMSDAPLKAASRQELVSSINDQASRIKTLNATVTFSASTGGARKGQITDYTDVSGYILVRQPAMLRMIGLVPIVRNRAFDMVSDGETFKLWLPAKNKFIVGHNEVIQPSKQALENLRPQHIYDALLLRSIDEEKEIAVLEQDNDTVRDPKTHKDVLQPNYIIDVLAHGVNGWYLSRKIEFSRVDLQPHQQTVYDLNGYVATEATYSDFQNYSGVVFPSVIHVWRPQEEYAVTLIMVKLTVNEPLSDEQFALAQPAGALLVNLNSGPEAGAHGNGAR